MVANSLTANKSEVIVSKLNNSDILFYSGHLLLELRPVLLK